MARRRHGITLIEQLVVLLVITILAAGIMTLMKASWDAQYDISNRNAAGAASRQAADVIVDGVRQAHHLSAATTTSLTWVDNNSNSTSYWVAGGALRRAVNGLPSGGQIVTTGIQGLSFSYGTWGGTAWGYSSNPATPANVGSVDVLVTASLRGFTRQYASCVRIRQKRCAITGTTKVF